MKQDSSKTGVSNEDLFARAQKALPGGVSSPVRAFRSVGGSPIVFERGKGAYFSDVEGKRYLDFVMSWGPLILGHAEPRVLEAVADAASRGLSFGAPCQAEIELAELVRDLHPCAEQVRFTSSGTEAAMSALRLARGATGRTRILKFNGCYHGHSDSLLVAAGSGLATFGKPSSDGVPDDLARWTSVLELDDEDALEAFFAEHGAELAVAVIEPVPANNGLLLQRKEYLVKLRELCTKHGAMLLFDEVISGFRLGPGGATTLYEVQPDMVCFGKVIGGGMPVGAFAASKEIMAHLAPEGGVYQAGTLSGNPVAMAAGLAQLRTLIEEDGWKKLEVLGRQLEEGFAALKERMEIPLQMARLGSLFWLAPEATQPYRSAASLPSNLGEAYRPLFAKLLANGIYLAPSAFEVGFLSLAHTSSDVERLLEAIAQAQKS
ncbi:MAG: aspartate aminotransferase family protein [Planctomycetota bacterium]|nr:MAG: aspartate aminotransferase family protein [Planctomycetota bacterium]